jgi:hypothetical protein
MIKMADKTLAGSASGFDVEALMGTEFLPCLLLVISPVGIMEKLLLALGKQNFALKLTMLAEVLPKFQ